METVNSTAPTLSSTFTSLLGTWGSAAIADRYAQKGSGDMVQSSSTPISANNADLSGTGGFSMSTGLMVGGAVLAVVALVLILKR